MSGLTIAGFGLSLVNPTSGGGINITQLVRGDFGSSVTQNISNTLNPQAVTFDTPIKWLATALIAKFKRKPPRLARPLILHRPPRRLQLRR